MNGIAVEGMRWEIRYRDGDTKPVSERCEGESGEINVEGMYEGTRVTIPPRRLHRRHEWWGESNRP